MGILQDSIALLQIDGENKHPRQLTSPVFSSIGSRSPNCSHLNKCVLKATRLLRKQVVAGGDTDVELSDCDSICFVQSLLIKTHAIWLVGDWVRLGIVRGRSEFLVQRHDRPVRM